MASLLKRKPLIGLLPPRGSRVLHIEPPIGPGEKPLLVGPTDDFVFEIESPSRVSLHNHNERPIAYVLTIVPTLVANATMLPWGRIIGQLKKPGGAKELADAFVESLHLGLLTPKE